MRRLSAMHEAGVLPAFEAVDSEVIEREGVADLSQYAVNPDLPLAPDFFVEPKDPLMKGAAMKGV